ncbi:hypothetical protein U0O11_08410 [Cobetia sp. D5]|uniref:hypothetical protein n=1 Tax=unclassified Cobetia TaxID=2609414 RepID=UPI001C04598E|nr:MULTISPECIES: hypothetical protein [unclassified Cobetia]MBR9754596.1 hypothetical protein [Gammaproteobacteria bacterium]QWN38496.1 hypothetical protein H2O77_08885 [Cobetia sp. 4B]
MRPHNAEPSLNDSPDDALVARPDDALGVHHTRPPAPRRWPTWLCLLALGGVVGWQQWQLHDLQTLGGDQRDQLGARVSQLERSVAQLEQQGDERLSELRDALGEQLSALDRQLNDTIVPALTNLQKDKASLSSEAVARLETLEDKVAKDADGAQERLTAMDEALDRLEGRVTTLAQTDDNHATLITALQGSMAALESLSRDGRAALGARLDAQSATLEHLEPLVDKTSSTLDTLATRIESLQSDIESEVENNSAEQLASLETRLTALKTDLATQQTQTRDLQQSQQQLSETLKSLPEPVEAADGDELASKLKGRFAPLDELAALETAQRSLDSQLGELRRQQTALSAGLEASSQGASEDTREQLRSLDASRRQLSGRVASLLGQVSELEQRVSRLERR